MTLGPLTGIRVIDLSQQLPGPYASLLLAQMGAEVIKIEPSTGDVARTIDERMFRAVNAGKRSVVLDLKKHRAQHRLGELARGCDVFLEGFRPGTVERLGADYPTIRAVRPDVVYCSLSGFGGDGPYRDFPGHDLNYLGIAGGVAANQEFEEIGVPTIDLGAGTLAALAIVSALFERTRTGAGRYLDIAMLDTAVFWAGVKAPALGGSEPAYMSAAAADGRSISVAVIEDKFWQNLCRCLGWTDWGSDPALATHTLRRKRGDQIRARLRDTLASRPRDEWLEELWAADVPAAPVNSLDEVALDPQVRARGLVSPGSTDQARRRSVPIPVAPVPAPLRAEPTADPPALGQDTDRIVEQRLMWA